MAELDYSNVILAQEQCTIGTVYTPASSHMTRWQTKQTR